MTSRKTSTASPAQVEANRRNAQKSTGPRTELGKIRSRANALKHGLTGAGIALPAEDSAQIGERFRAINQEMAPYTTVGALLTHQIALMSVRLNRAARRETAILSHKIRHAGADFDEARLAEAEHTLGYIGMEPITHRRKLRSTPEGIEVLVRALRGIRRDLAINRERWDYMRELTLEAYLGRRIEEVPMSRSRVLSHALQGRTEFLDPEDLEAIEHAPHRFGWAQAAMLELLDAEIADLLAHRATLDFDAIAQDRAEAGERALFDASKDATLARRYESAASRELYRALREFREVEATGEIDTPEPPEVVEAARATTFEAGDDIPTPAIPIPPEDRVGCNSCSCNTFITKSGSFGKSTCDALPTPIATIAAAPHEPEFAVDREISPPRLDP